MVERMEGRASKGKVSFSGNAGPILASNPH